MVDLKTLVAVLILVFCAMNAPKTSADNNGGVPALFSFGDSILDTGNNNLLITLTKGNYPPYGRDFPGGIPTGRFCNGRNPSDLIAEALGVKATVPAYLGGSLRDEDLPTGVTFASGGSGIDPVTSGIQGVLSLSSQLRLFEQYIERLKALVGEERASYIVSHALVLYSSGNNDIAITYYDTLTHLQPFSIYSDGLVSGSSKFIMSLYGLGVRRMWVFSTLPLGCLPGGRTIAGGPLRFCAPIVNLQAQFFNAKLASAVSSIRSRYPDFDIRFIDVYTPLYNLVHNPQSLGFVDASEGCCGTAFFGVSGLCTMLSVCPDPSTYVFWDFAHPTERAYKYIVSDVLKKQGIDVNNVATSFSFSRNNSSLLH